MENECDRNEPNNPSMVIKPRDIDFGILPHGDGATVTLSILGGPGSVIFSSDHFMVKPTNFPLNGGDIVITLLPGSCGELIWDEIVLHTDRQEITVPVTARWEVRESERPIYAAEETPSNQRIGIEVAPKDRRTFKGKACPLCGKNFAYHVESMSWDECKCNWFQRLVNMGKYHIKELRSGIKDLPVAFKDTWHVLSSKEKF